MSFFLSSSCTKNEGPESGSKIYYVIRASYDNPLDHYGITDAEVTHLALTMPNGNLSTSENLSTPYTGNERDYTLGMSISATVESVLTHVTLMVEIWRDGAIWKQQTVLGSDSYSVVTLTGTL